jgi:hypothetical protein
MAATDQPKHTLYYIGLYIILGYVQQAEYYHADAMQIFSFCMSVLNVEISDVFSGIYGAPVRIKLRTRMSLKYRSDFER